MNSKQTRAMLKKLSHSFDIPPAERHQFAKRLEEFDRYGRSLQFRLIAKQYQRPPQWWPVPGAKK